MKFTIMGGTGFIGRNLAQHLIAEGYDVEIAPRNIKILKGKDLGHVIYAIGLTGDTRERPHDAIEAHVSLLSWALKNISFNSFLYCSSTRLYGGLPPESVATENTAITVIPDEDSLFDLSKLLAESLCQRMRNPAIKIARLSNVYGEGQSKATFLGAVIDEVKRTGVVKIMDSPDSVKDYIAIKDVNILLTDIILKGQQSLYNVCSGTNIRCRSIAEWIENLGYKVLFSGENPKRMFPVIDNSLIKQEFNFKPRSLEYDIHQLLEK